MIEYINVNKLKNHPNNPRRIKEYKLIELGESLIKNPEFFKSRPLICDKNLIVWAGNSRLKAAKKVGIKEVPCTILDLPEEKMKEIMIRDNVNSGEWDGLILNNWNIDNLIDWGIELKNDTEIDELTDESKPKNKKEKKCPHCGGIL